MRLRDPAHRAKSMIGPSSAGVPGRGSARRFGHRLDERALQLRQRGEWPARGGPLGDPRRMLVDAGEQGDEARVVGVVEALQRQGFDHRRLSVAQSVTRTVFTTGCKVLTYHSQIVFDPDRTFEIFVLDREP